MNIENLIVGKDTTIKKALKLIDKNAKRILLVCENRKIKATLTDGDIRRWILKNGDLNEKVELIMNENPIYLNEREKDKALEIMKDKFIEAIPLVNDINEVVSVCFWNELNEKKLNHFEKLENTVVIMAGGKGTRLYPYTKILPKPLVPIGDTPIVERIIDNFHEYGCSDFYLTVNYKKNMIKAYFNELEKGYKTHFIEESKPLGTGGSLHLLKGKLEKTFFVSNCDILVDANYSDILKYHKEKGNKITMVTSLKHYTIPYGVIEINDAGGIQNTVEKPEYDFLVNTGMYVLEPEVINDVPEDTFFHITDLIDIYMKKGEKVGTYPLSEQSWLDMGQFKEMEEMMKKLGVK